MKKPSFCRVLLFLLCAGAVSLSSAHQLQEPLKIFVTKTKYGEKDGAAFSLGSPTNIWSSGKSEFKFVQSDGKNKTLGFLNIGKYAPGTTSDVFKVLDQLVGLELVDEISLKQGSFGLAVSYSIENIKLKNGVVIRRKNDEAFL